MSEISDRLVQALMFHDQMTDYFDFLGLHGFKRMHEYRYFRENAEMRGVHRYFLNHYNELLNDNKDRADDYIPMAWRGVNRMDVNEQVRKDSVKNSMENWRTWESDSKKFYEMKVGSLKDLREFACADKVMGIVRGVDKELKCIDRLMLELKAVGYDMSVIIDMQKRLHDKYEKKLRKVGVKMC